MTVLSPKLRAYGAHAEGIVHWCPGCNEAHIFHIKEPNWSGARWTWDGNVDAPTCTPSMNIRTNQPDMKGYSPCAGSSVCHYFLRSGQIQFLGECTHALAGQTVPLPDWPEL